MVKYEIKLIKYPNLMLYIISYFKRELLGINLQ